MWPVADDGPNVLPASLTAFFLVPLKREKIPVWVFNPESLADGHAGLVLNMSQGELHGSPSTHRKCERASPFRRVTRKVTRSVPRNPPIRPALARPITVADTSTLHQGFVADCAQPATKC